MPQLQIKRVYDKPSKKDGYRILIDRLWPRGLTLQQAGIDEWEKELAPSTGLRKWFGHDPERWKQFQKKYIAELKINEMVDLFTESHKDRKLVTLVYAAKDDQHNHAVVLLEYLEKQFNVS